MKLSEETALREALTEEKEDKRLNLGGILQKSGQEQRLIFVSPDKIYPNPFQPRRDFDEDKLWELAENIRENGILQPLVIRKARGNFELVAGERRLRAAKLLGLRSLPCVLGKYSDEQSSVLAIVENIQRKELNFFEEADAIGRLIVCHELTQEQVALKLGKSQPAIANKLRLLRLSGEIRRKITENGLTERHARCLLRLNSEEEAKKVLEKVIAQELNVSETEELVEKILNSKPKQKRRQMAAVKDMRLFYNTLDKAVRSIKSTGLRVETEKQESEGVTEYVIRMFHVEQNGR